MLFVSNFIVPFYQGIENQILGKFWSYGRRAGRDVKCNDIFLAACSTG